VPGVRDDDASRVACHTSHVTRHASQAKATYRLHETLKHTASYINLYQHTLLSSFLNLQEVCAAVCLCARVDIHYVRMYVCVYVCVHFMCACVCLLERDGACVSVQVCTSGGARV